jgi:hypothetical protein
MIAHAAEFHQSPALSDQRRICTERAWRVSPTVVVALCHSILPCALRDVVNHCAETIPAVNEADIEAGSSYGRPSALSAALGTSLGTSPADVRRRTYN